MSSAAPSEPAPTARILAFAGSVASADGMVARIRSVVPEAQIEPTSAIVPFGEACKRPPGWDVVLVSCRRMLDTTTARALELARRLLPGVPLVVLGERADEQLIVECMSRGATDYVSPRQPDRLGPALERALSSRATTPAANTPAGHPAAPSVVCDLIAQNSRDLICLHDLDRRINFASPSVRTLLGYSPDSCVGVHPRDLIHPDDITRLGAQFSRIGEQVERGAPVLLRVRHAEGHFLWLETLVETIADPDGRPAQLMSISRDFTEHQRIEEAMLRDERLFEGIAEVNRLLLTSRHVAEVLPSVLHALGEAAGVDRVLVFEFRSPTRSLHPTRTLRGEWVVDESLSVFSESTLSDIPLNELGGNSPFARLAAAETIECRVASLPEREREFWQEHGLRSLLAFPLLAGGRCWGCLTIEQCRSDRDWTATERTALRTAADNIGQAIEREKTLDALAESERHYETLLAGLSEGVFQIDLEGRWRFLNPTWEELTGHPVNQSVGRRFSDFIGIDDATIALDGFGQLLSGRASQVEYEVRFLHRTGRELWMRVTARPQVDGNGRVTGVSGTLVDVTQRRLAQEALGASERKFAAVFANASDALILVDSEGDLIVECNPRASEMFGCERPGELVGTAASELFAHRADASQVRERRTQLARGAVWAQQLECVTRRGKRFWGQVAVVRMTNEVAGTTLVRITDVTEAKRTEERLRASVADKEVLLKEVYHRVKNNLQIISALLRMQTRKVSDRTALSALENSISRVMAMSMVHEKLYQAQNLVSIDFLAFAQSLVGFLNQLTIGGRSEITIEVSGVSLALSIDQAIPLGLVLNELVTNSLKYAFPDGLSGHVVIHIGMDGPQTARVTVSDDGIGLPDGIDVDNANGLGFRITRMLVEQLHGTLDVESRGGLRAIVRMPFTPPAVAPEELA